MPDLERVESLFHEALVMPPEVDRLEWLEMQCQGDSKLFGEVSSLLETRAKMAGVEQPFESPPMPSAQFGAYRAVKLLGRGGMSAVYLAERADGQFEQTVALKVMAGYLADRDFFRRFNAERQFLAALNHHNITRLLDGGVSSGGDPYLITEYVDGETIDRYCEERRLAVESRLRIFLQVLEAVEYAHRNLIVHRDLKPANIMVDKEGVAKLLDFGTASLTAGAQNNPTVTRLRMLTPRYASPEQLRGERVNVATDVFSLGVILYELLTGAWPFGDPNSILREIDRTTGYITARPPSTAITEEAARTRSISREQLSRALKGDLSAIVLKALESDPSKRYESVRDMAADIENFIARRPVTAQPQTAVYRAGKFLRRRWLLMSAAAVFVIGLTAAAIVAEHQARVARVEARRAEEVSGFLGDMLSSLSDYTVDPQKFTVAQLLDVSEARLGKNGTGDPRTEAILRRSLANGYGAVMRLDRAKPQLERSLAIFRALGDDDEANTTLMYMGGLAAAEGRVDDCVRIYDELLRNWTSRGPDAPATLVLLKIRLAATLALNQNRRLPEARQLFDDAITLIQRDSSIPRIYLASATAYRAMMILNEGKPDEAKDEFQKALAIGRKEDPNGVWQAFSLLGLATVAARENPAEAAGISRQRYELLASHLGAGHAVSVAARLFWVRCRVDAGGPGEPAAKILEAMQIVRGRFPSPLTERWLALCSSAHILNQAERYKEAESLAREMLPILDANHVPDYDPRRAESLFELGRALVGEKRNREAMEVLQKSVSIYNLAGPGSATMAGRVRKLMDEINRPEARTAI